MFSLILQITLFVLKSNIKIIPPVVAASNDPKEEK